MPADQFLYIISDYKFHKHGTIEAAKTEKARLEGKFPDRKFRIYWVRRKINRHGDPVEHLPPEVPAKKLVLKLKAKADA